MNTVITVKWVFTLLPGHPIHSPPQLISVELKRNLSNVHFKSLKNRGR